MKLVLALVVALFLSPLARAASDDELACALPEPGPTKPIPTGIDLGEIVQMQLSQSGAYTAAVEPSVQLDLDFGARVVNLTHGPATRGLVFAESTSGYQALDYGSLEAGLGGKVAFNFGNSTLLAPGLWASVGLLPLAGGGVEAWRYYANRRGLETRAALPISGVPVTSLDGLRVHDTFRYDTYGGLVFWVGAGYGAVGGVTAPALAEGRFEVRVEKLDADHVYVRIADADLKSLGIQAGNFLANASITQFSRYAGSLGFAINFHDRLGAAAYHDLVHGNAAPVQKLALRGGDSVRFLGDEASAQIGATSRIWLGIPVLFNIAWTHSNYLDAVRHRYYSCGRSLRATYGAFLRRREGNAFGVGQETSRAFYGTSYALVTAKGDRDLARGFFGQLIWSYKGTKTLPDTFRHAMAELGSDTGLGSALVLAVPASVTQRLGYTSLTLRAQLDAAHVLHLLQRANGGGPRLHDLAASYASSYFTTALAADEACASLGSSDHPAPTGSACVARVMSDTAEGADKMLTALAQMSAALRRGDEKGATGSFARFGEAMLTNQFTMLAGLQLAGGGVPVDYVAEGSDFYRYVSLSRTDGDSGRLVPDRRAPLYIPGDGRGPHETDAVLVTPVP